MMVGDQDLPIATFSPKAANDALASVGNADPATGPAKHIGPGVNRIGQDMMDGIVNRELPDDAASIIDGIAY